MQSIRSDAGLGRAATNAMSAFGGLFKGFVSTLRQREGVMSCAHQPCNSLDLVILICKMESGEQRYVCGVPFCKGHARSTASGKSLVARGCGHLRL